MAGDWIKLRTDLHTDPAVIRLGTILSLDAFAVVGRLAAVWVWADTHADRHGHVTLVSRSCLDSVTHCEGFGAALESVGWLECSPESDGGVTFPRFDRHMGEGAKARAQAAKRKRKQRELESRNGHGDVTPLSRKSHSDIVTREREEERREEEEKDPPKPPAKPGGSEVTNDTKRKRVQKPGAETVFIPEVLQIPEFTTAWGDWLEDRRDRNKKVTARGAAEQLAKLAPLGPTVAIQWIRNAIAQGWTGLYEPKNQSNGTTATNTGNVGDRQRDAIAVFLAPKETS